MKKETIRMMCLQALMQLLIVSLPMSAAIFLQMIIGFLFWDAIIIYLMEHSEEEIKT